MNTERVWAESGASRQHEGENESQPDHDETSCPALTAACRGAPVQRFSGIVKAVMVVPDPITTCCRPSSMNVIGAAPQIGEPVG